MSLEPNHMSDPISISAFPTLRNVDGMAVIGRTLHDLRGIRYDEGEGGNAASTDTSTATGAAATGADAGASSATGTADASTATAWDGKIESLDPAAQKIITDLRKEAGDNRVKAKAESDRVEAILKAAGIKTDEPDPVAVAKSATEAATKATRELAVFKAAAASGADPSKLLDRASFLASISGLDPADGAAITAAINTAIAADPTLKAVLAASASGTELGGTGETGQITEAQLARMTAEQIVDAQNKGLLKNLLG